MKNGKKLYSAIIFVMFFALMLMIAGLNPVIAADMPGFDAREMSDMSDYDPNNMVIPTGDTIKIAIVAGFSGPAAQVGQIYFNAVQWVAHDLNKRGGITIDGKKKLIQVIAADHMGKPAQAKKVTERMILKEGVKLLWGTNSSALSKIISQVAKKYNVIYNDAAAVSDELMDGKNFNPNTFMTSVTTGQIGDAVAAYYAKRNKETKFYILGQDYLFGHAISQGFKDGLKKHFPKAEIMGEDYHPLFAKDFAPYITKVKASGAEVLYTGDWIPDIANLLKQTRQLGVKIPLAGLFIDEPNMLAAVGIEGTKGIVLVGQNLADLNDYNRFNFFSQWHFLWLNKWKEPYNAPLYKWPGGNTGLYVMATYWMMSVVERAGSLDTEKIINVWEGDKYKTDRGVLEMRPCDHKTIRDLYISEYVYPNQWFDGSAYSGPITTIPAADVMPIKAEDLDRCK